MVEMKPTSQSAIRIPDEWRNLTETEFNFGQFAWLLPALRRWKWISAATVLGLLTGLTYIVMQGRTYEAVAQLEIETTEKRVVRVDSVTSDVSPDKSIVDGQIELMRSASLARYLIKTLGLYGIPAEPVTATAADPQLGVPDDLVELFLASLTVERVGATFLVDVKFSNPDPKTAAKVANAIGTTYMQRKQQARISATRQANQWLQAQIETMRGKVQAAEEKTLQYRMDHDLIQVGQQNLNEVELGQHTNNLINARANVLKFSARQRQVEQIGSDKTALRALSFVSESKQISDLEHTAADLRSKAADLKTRFGANHPDVENALSQLQSLNGRIDDEVQRVVAGLKQSLAIAVQEVQLLETEFNKLKGELTRKNLDTLELGELERDRESTKTLYVNFLTRLKETQAQETLPGDSAIVVSEAFAPSKPTSSRRTVTIAATTLLGALLGYLASLITDLRASGIVKRWKANIGTAIAEPAREPKDRTAGSKLASQDVV